MSTPWAPPPPPRPGRIEEFPPGTRIEILTHGAPSVFVDCRVEPLRRPIPPPNRPEWLPFPGPDPVVRRRHWICFESAAALWSAPWWLLYWILTVGRMGRPLWEWEPVEPRVRGVGLVGYDIGGGYQPLVSTTDPARPPQTVSGVPTANTGTR